MIRYMVVFALISVFAVPAAAEHIYCRGTLDRVYMTTAGNVYMRGSWNDGYLRICNTQTADDVVMCSLWSSHATSALQNGTEVQVSYNVTPGVTCGTVPTGSDSLAISYLMLIK